VVATAVEVIERNARLQARLVTDLLDISRAISGNLDLELEDVAFTETHRHGVTAFDRVGAR
jgi:signal transduction histidine kinase